MPSPLGEGGRRPDEGRVCRYDPVRVQQGKAAPHQSASQSASPEGEAFFLAIADKVRYNKYNYDVHKGEPDG